MKRVIPADAASIASLACTISLAFAQTNDPTFAVLPRAIVTNHSVQLLSDMSALPGGGGSQDSPVSPAPYTNFVAMTNNGDSYTFPPDTHGAVGINHVMAMHNEGVRIQTKASTTIHYTTRLKDFWTNNIGPAELIADPRIVYDPFHDRWLAVVALDPRTNTSSLAIAVSMTSDPHPTNGWRFHRFDADTNKLLWADQPTFGFNKDWIVIQANMAEAGAAVPAASFFFVFNKTNAYAGGPGWTNAVRLFHNDPDAACNERPAITYDNSLDKIYLIQNAHGNYGGTNGRLRLFTISGAIGSPTLNYTGTNAIYIEAGDTWADNVSTNSQTLWKSCCSPQLGTNATIGTVADARFDSVVYRHGSLWCAHTIFLPATNVSRSSVQWWQIMLDTPGNPIVFQRGRIDDVSGANFYAFPSVAVNRFKDVLVGYSSFSATQYASANYSFRPFYLEANKMYDSYRYKAGTDIYMETPARWGDYSATVVDPANDTDFWTIQEYACSNNIMAWPGRGDSWATEWAHVAIAGPTNDPFVNALTISGFVGCTNSSNLRATKEVGEPAHSGNTNSPSVWFSWTAPTNGQVTISVDITKDYGRMFNSILAVYTGLSVTNLTEITNDHGGIWGSQVVFDAVGDTTYQIAVAGFNNTMGDFALSWLQTLPPYFCLHPQSSNVVAGENVTFRSHAIGIPAPTYQWLSNEVAIVDATNANYTITDAQPTEQTNYFFYCAMATNSYGNVTSQVALLVVHDAATAQITNCVINTNAYFVMHVHGVTNRAYVVETTTNLNSPTEWESVMTNHVSFNYTNFFTSNDVARFYRIVTDE